MFAAIRNGWVRLDGDVHNSTTYEWNGQTVVAYSDPLPLTVEDLTGITAEGYSRHWETEASLLLKREKGEQRARYDVEEYLPRLGVCPIYHPLFGHLRAVSERAAPRS